MFRSPHRFVWPAELDPMAQLAGMGAGVMHADWAGAESTRLEIGTSRPPDRPAE